MSQAFSWVVDPTPRPLRVDDEQLVTALSTQLGTQPDQGGHFLLPSGLLTIDAAGSLTYTHIGEVTAESLGETFEEVLGLFATIQPLLATGPTPVVHLFLSQSQTDGWNAERLESVVGRDGLRALHVEWTGATAYLETFRIAPPTPSLL